MVGQKLDGEIIIYSSKQLFISEKNPNSISFYQSHTIKENKKKYLIDIIKKSWYTYKKNLLKWMALDSSECSHALSSREEEIIKAGDVFFSDCKWMEISIPKTWIKIIFFFNLNIYIHKILSIKYLH